MSKHLMTFFRVLPGLFFNVFTLLTFYFAIFNHQIFFYISGGYMIFLSYQATRIAVWGMLGYFRMKRNANTDWIEKYRQRKEKLEKSGDEVKIKWEDTVHFLIVPNYKEHLSTLYEMLDRAKENTIAKSHVIVVLAMEAREKGAQEKANGLVQKYNDDFKDFIVSLHPPGVVGEIAGKASNEQYAALQIEKYLEEKKDEIDMEKAIISVADADSGYHSRYFEYLNYTFIFNQLRHSVVYQSVICNYKNFETVPAFTRLLGSLITLHEIASLTDPLDSHLPFSTYSFSYLFFKRIKGWDTDIIAEDWHLYLKSFFATSGGTHVEPLMLPTNVYNVESETYMQSLKERYTQGIRHAWGIWEVSYIYTRFWQTWTTIITNPRNFLKTLNLMYKSLAVHILAGFSVWMSLVSGLVFAWNIYVYNYSTSLNEQVVAAVVINDHSWLFRMASTYVGLPQFFVLLLNHLLFYYVQKKKTDTPAQKKEFVYMFLYYCLEFAVLNPFSAFIYATIPTYYSSTRLMFTENFTYIVAPKPMNDEDRQRLRDSQAELANAENSTEEGEDNFDDEELVLSDMDGSDDSKTLENDDSVKND